MASFTATKTQSRSKGHGKGKPPPGKVARGKAKVSGVAARVAGRAAVKKNGKGTNGAAKPPKIAQGKSAKSKPSARPASRAKIISPAVKLKAAKNTKLTASKKSARVSPLSALPKANGKALVANGAHRNGTNGRDAKNMDTLDKPTQKAGSNGIANGRNGDSGVAAKQSEIVLPPTYKPSENEPFMSAKHRTYFRMKLLKWKEDIVLQNLETLKGLHDDSPQQADPADRATAETDRALELRARDRQRKLMGKIDSALARLEEGSYGYCEETGEPISLKRLDARPIATLSLEAQERRERRERIFRED